MVSHYLMIPYLKQNYETIIRAIYHCSVKTPNKSILQILGTDIDVSKFFSSITEFLEGYNQLNPKTESDNEFIQILDALIKLKPAPLRGGATKKIFKSAKPNSKLTKRKC